MHPEDNNYCHYSDLPSPMAYMQREEEEPETKKENSQQALPKTNEVKNEEISKRTNPNTNV